MRTKYLWTLAIAVLCASVMTGSAMAQDSWFNDAATVLPSALVWDETTDPSVTANNDGSTTWDSATYDLRSVEGTTSGGVSAVDRWGLTLVPMVSLTVGNGGTEVFDFNVTAPPITGTFECDWVMAESGSPFLTDLAEADVEITRYPDVGIGHWASSQVEACAGNVPFIVQGFPDGLFRPALGVTRDAMAVFIHRGMDVVLTTPTEETFPDVPSSYWAYYNIENLAEAGVVQGYPNGYYRPDYSVSRDQMAVFVARAKSYFLTIPGSAPFPDVAVDHWAAQEIQACVNEGVVQGYPDGLYRPNVNIDRAQMAVYSQRAFVSPSGGTGAAVVLGGPGLTDVDPGVVSYDGWSTDLVDPDTAYVVFDAARLGTALATDTGGTWDVVFEFRDAAAPTGPAVMLFGFSISPAVISGASGTYFSLWSTGLEGSLAAGDYVFVVIVEDKQGDMIELARTVAYTIN
jgi:hypothetical protein